MRRSNGWTLVFGAAAALALMGAAQAETMKLKATLDGKSEVPPVNTGGTGMADVSYDPSGKKLSYKVTYSGLTGPATMAHFHGPAEPGKNAGVVVPLTGNTPGTYEGTATLTDAQATDLLGGRWYVNVHTQQNPPGEIRGQVTKAQ